MFVKNRILNFVLVIAVANDEKYNIWRMLYTIGGDSFITATNKGGFLIKGRMVIKLNFIS